MSSQFLFSFCGDDIVRDGQDQQPDAHQHQGSAATTSAFPVQGQPLLAPTHHPLSDILSRLPSKIAYSVLDVQLDGNGRLQIPRREFWDVRVQMMAEEDTLGPNPETEPISGKLDVKTGIYEGGFKSWESSVDLVKVLASENCPQLLGQQPCRVVELGCGTALPSLALFRWACMARRHGGDKVHLSFTLCDYNPTVLYLVTLPNLILSWALSTEAADLTAAQLLPSNRSGADRELELSEQVLGSFKDFLSCNNINLYFFSGGWCPAFVDLLYSLGSPAEETLRTLILGAETIYSPFALNSFAETLLCIFERERRERPTGHAVAIVAAKRLYFGVGGSLDDFVGKMSRLGATVEAMREESDGVRRGVVKCFKK